MSVILTFSSYSFPLMVISLLVPLSFPSTLMFSCFVTQCFSLKVLLDSWTRVCFQDCEHLTSRYTIVENVFSSSHQSLQLNPTSTIFKYPRNLLLLLLHLFYSTHMSV